MDYRVPAAENGFLALYQLGRELPISEEFSKILSDGSSCDLTVARRCLSEHQEWVERIETIAALNKRSSIGMPGDFQGFSHAKTTKQCFEILLLKARLAAESGDENEAHRYVSSAGNLVDHLRKVETPTMLTATVVLLMDVEIERSIFSTLLPALGKSADLEIWRQQLNRRRNSIPELADALRGEWHTGADYWAFPMLAMSGQEGDLPDVEMVLRLYSSWMSDCVAKLPSLAFSEIESSLPRPQNGSGLSKAGREMFDTLTLGFSHWLKGYTRVTVVSAQYQAAMDLLIMEKAGAKLVADDAARVARDPVSGGAFQFDAASRMVSEPAGSKTPDVTPLALPW